MSKCEHLHKIGDNYGVTCQDCGEVLEGYGYRAEGSRVCRHRWFKIHEDEEQCMYCEAIQERLEKAN